MMFSRNHHWQSLKLAGLFVLLAMAGLAAVFRPAFQPPDTNIEAAIEDGDFAASLDAVYARSAWSSSIAGVSAAYIAADGTLETWSSGTTRALGGASVTQDTVFEVASLSKPLTAYAVMRLANQGRLDLDEARTVNGVTFTLGQVLSHTGGFDNRLSSTPEPDYEPGSFRYAGGGYLYLAQAIEAATGQSFEDHLNEVVLPELGMTNSRFGRATPGQDRLAMPALDVSFGFAIVALVTGLLAVPMLLIIALFQFLFRKRQGRNRGILGTGVAVLSLAGGFGLYFLMIGAANWLVMAPAIAGLFALLAAAIWCVRNPAPAFRALSAVLLIATICILAARPALPQNERTPRYLAASGLRTTAPDYARFLHTVLNSEDPVLRSMLEPAVSVSENNGWGPGFAVQTTGDPAIWHWGVNFPGYQAFAIGWVEQRDAMVVLHAGGNIAITPAGIRYSGLELAYDAINETVGRLRGGYWAETG